MLTGGKRRCQAAAEAAAAAWQPRCGPLSGSAAAQSQSWRFRTKPVPDRPKPNRQPPLPRSAPKTAARCRNPQNIRSVRTASRRSAAIPLKRRLRPQRSHATAGGRWGRKPLKVAAAAAAAAPPPAVRAKMEEETSRSDT